jgi:hypothetical protein
MKMPYMVWYCEGRLSALEQTQDKGISAIDADSMN